MVSGDREEIQARRESRDRMVELYLWSIAAFVISGRLWIMMLRFGRFHPDMLTDFYLDVLAGVLCLIFPILYRLIFGLLPLQHLRLARLTAPERAAEARIIVERVPATPERVSRPSYSLTKDTEPLAVLAQLTQSSRNLSDRIFTRAGIYLIVGVLIAFSGLIFFYTQTAGTNPHVAPSDASPFGIAATQVATLAPRFGILGLRGFVWVKE